MATSSLALPPISVVLPIGPQHEYLHWLGECLDSIRTQTYFPYEIIVISDGADLSKQDLRGCTVFHNPWPIGCGLSWNFGVALSKTNCVFLMGSDDKLLPECLEACAEAYMLTGDTCGFYNVTCITSQGEVISLFNNAAMVTKELWALTGGFPITSTVGAPDALLISILLKHRPHHLHQVREGIPLYWVRIHDSQDTLRYAAHFSEEVISVRNKETARWRVPAWGGRLVGSVK